VLRKLRSAYSTRSIVPGSTPAGRFDGSHAEKRTIADTQGVGACFRNELTVGLTTLENSKGIGWKTLRKNDVWVDTARHIEVVKMKLGGLLPGR
jgi:hypothetical protein